MKCRSLVSELLWLLVMNRPDSLYLQMIKRPLLTPDELKSMPKGQFVVMKTGALPMKVKLKLFFKWGIQSDGEHPYTVADNGNRKVQYAEKKEIMDGINQKYHPKLAVPAIPTIVRELKLSESTIRRTLRDLRSAGLLETEQRYREKGGKSSLLYKISGKQEWNR